MSNVENPRGIDFPKIVSRLEWLSAGGRHAAPRTPMSISGITERLSNGTTFSQAMRRREKCDS